MKGEVSREEALELLKVDENSADLYEIMIVANTLRERYFGN